MSGRVVPILSRRFFDFSGTSSSTSETIIVKAVDVSQYTQGELQVRVHKNSTITGSASVDVLARVTSPTSESSDADFVDYSAAVVTVNVASGDTSSSPTLKRAALSSGFGGMLQISVTANPDGTGPQTIQPELSIDLVLKD